MKQLILIILVLVHTALSAKILAIFPTPSISHQVVFRALMKDLAARGHQLTILTPDPFKTDNPNVTQIDLHDSYVIFQKEFNFVEFKNSDNDETDLMNWFTPIMLKYLEAQLSHPEVKKLINEKEKYKFDLLIMEGLMNYPILGFAEIYDIPVIEISSLDALSDNHANIGNAVNHVIYPEIMFPFQQKRLTFLERWQVVRYLVKSFMFESKKISEIEKFTKRHFLSIKNPKMKALRSRIEFMMTNTHPALGYLRPLLPNTIQLGFMHIEPPKPLPEGSLKKFLDNSKHGVIYMSLGSNVKSEDLSDDVRKIFISVFSILKYDVLWKFEADELPNKPKNVMIQKWLPQADLLAHPNVKLFITHGGQQSMEETIDRAVPTVVIPFLGDQDANARKMEHKNIGKALELHTLTEAQLKAAIDEMMKPKYKKNIENLRSLVYDQPMSSREKAVWWTEYVIRHKGAKHFVHFGKDVPFYEKYLLDFVLIGVILAIFVVKSIFYASKMLFRQNSSKRKSE